ncbi:MAG: exopolysaccharide biosynthesis protein [Kiritimatiellia bacterium]|jgi:exopolysaccharide biosynthesis protein
MRVLLLALVVSTSACAKDQAAFAAGWKSEVLSPGLTWKQQKFTDLYNSPQVVNVLELDTTQHSIKFVTLEDSPLTVRQIGETNKAIAAVNGTYFDINRMVSTAFIKVDDRIVSRSHPHEPRQRAAIVIDGKGRIDLLRRPEGPGWDTPLPFPHILSASPMLVTHHKPWDHSGHEYGDERHPRTAAGLTDDQRLLLVTVDGRSKIASGMSYTELGETMSKLGCHTALCLDGGGSTTLWLRGKGVVNQPSDRSLLMRKSLERVMPSAIIIPE